MKKIIFLSLFFTLCFFNYTFAGDLILNNSSGNVGIGISSPSQKLDVNGNIKCSGNISTSTLSYGDGGTRVETKSDAGAIGNAKSGFYQTEHPVNYPTGATGWWHMIEARHSNANNNYALQIAGSFFDQSLWFRKTNDKSNTSWSRIYSTNDSVFTGNITGNAATATNATNANYATTAGSANSVTWANITGKPNLSSSTFQWNWSGQGGQPNWLWGGGNGVDMYVYNPSNFSVNYANSAGTATTATNATNAGNSDTADGLHVHTGRNNEVNKIVRTDGSGYIQAGYINSNSGDEGNNSNPARVWGTNGSDSYLRTYLTSALSVSYASSAGSAASLSTNNGKTGKESRLYRSDSETSFGYYIRHYWTGNSNGWRIIASNDVGDEQNNIHRVSVDKSDYADYANDSGAVGGWTLEDIFRAMDELVPSGSIMAFNKTSCPAGWIPCDGTNGTLDLRGVFLRGVGTPAGYTDSSGGHALGTKQYDAIQGHYHNIIIDAARTAGTAGSGSYLTSTDNNASASVTGVISDPAYGTVRVSTETRPKNVAVLYCQKN